MAKTSDIRNGLMIRFRNDIFSVVEFLHVKPGKGAAFVRTKLKSMTTGSVIDHTFNAGISIDTVRVERRKYQYLYPDGEVMMFMNTETYEQLGIEKKLIENVDLMKENTEVELLVNSEDESILTVDLPKAVELEVTYTEPGVKGDTVSNTTKPATLETGAEIKVPLFINIGDVVKVETETRSYAERVKN